MVYGHDCDGPVSLIIEDGDFSHVPESPATNQAVGLPVSGDGISIHKRKDGPAAITRRAEADFPMQAFGENWFEYISAYNEGGSIQQARVQMDYPDGTHKTVFQGYIGSVGASGDNIGHLTMFGPYNLLKSVSIGGTINTEGGFVDGVLGWVARKFEDLQPTFDNVEVEFIEPDVEDPGPRGADPRERLREAEGTAAYIDNYFNRTKTFSANRDTLADVLRWIKDYMNVEIWFEPHDGDGILMRAEYDKGSFDGNAHDATHDGEINLIKNNALYEMKPYNAIRLQGRESSITEESDSTIGIPISSGNYPEAVAYYPPLVQRSGGRITMTQKSDINSQPELAGAAKKRLKSALDDVSGGVMTMELNPNMQLFDKIIAQPACAGNFEVDLPALTYEIQRVAHIINPNQEENHVPTTEIAVSMSIDPSKIETSTTLKTTTPSESGDNEPKGDQWFLDKLDYSVS